MSKLLFDKNFMGMGLLSKKSKKAFTNIFDKLHRSAMLVEKMLSMASVSPIGTACKQ